MVWRTLLYSAALVITDARTPTTTPLQIRDVGGKIKGKKNNLFLRLSMRHRHHRLCSHRVLSLTLPPPLTFSLSLSLSIFLQCLSVSFSALPLSYITRGLGSSVPKSTGVTTAKGAFHLLNIFLKKSSLAITHAQARTHTHTHTYAYIYIYIIYNNIIIYNLPIYSLPPESRNRFFRQLQLLFSHHVIPRTTY